MTALAGFWSLDGPRDAERRCERMLEAQRIHAPEPAGLWSDEGIALGRRLFRLLPEDGFDRGPIVGAGGKCVLVADIRLDNRDELGRELGLGSAETRQMADAAILMRALERWDEGAVERLVGDFAFALWEADRQRLLLARDFLGQRPLHFHRAVNFVAFASMPKGLHALSEIPVAPDRTRIAGFLALLPETGSASFFAGVEKVRPGQIVTIGRDGISARKYWQPPAARLRLATPEDYAEGLREQLDRAVAARLRGADGRVAAHLSAGLDSGAVSATAARLLAPLGGTVTAFTSVPREGYETRPRRRIADEGALSASVAAMHPNMEHVLIRAGGSSPLAGLDRAFSLYERPLLNLCNGVWIDAINDAAKARGLAVLLTGSFGNMSFSYDGMPWLTQLMARGRLLRLGKEAWLLRRRGVRMGTIVAQALGPFLPGPMRRGIDRVRGKASRLADHSAVNPAAAARLAPAERGPARTLDPIEARLQVLRRLDPGNYNKGALGGWGIDVRDPTADRRLMEFCLAVPAEQFVNQGMTRALARRALADRLPESVRLESRKGYQSADWHEGLTAARGELRDEVERIGTFAAAEELLDLARLRRLIDEWPERGWDEDRTIGNYRLSLLRGVSAGHFLRKAMGANP